MIYPYMLYPLWAGLGPITLRRRYVIALALCSAIFIADTCRGLVRGHHQPRAADVAALLLTFAWMTLCVWFTRRFSRWRLGIPGTPAQRGAQGRLWKIQFRLRHLFECTALAAAVLALYRLYFPDGLPEEFIAEFTANWRPRFSQFIQTMPFVILFLLPTTFIPLAVLALRGDGGFSVLWVTAAAVSWIALDGGLVWLGGVLRFVAWPEILAAQLGASASGAISAIVLRAVGFRIVRKEMIFA